MAFFKSNPNGTKTPFREKVARFMQGRNGVDELYRATFILYIVIIVLSLFIRSGLLYILSFALIAVMFFRLFSSNVEKRRRENARYVELRERARKKTRLLTRRAREARTHVYHDCPKCKATLRLPRMKGAHVVRCPKCGERFEVKVRF